MHEADKARRCILMAQHMCLTEETVRETARRFGVSKSLAHREMTIRLKALDKTLYERVQKVLAYHKSVRHLRGGEATKLRYLQKNNEKVVNATCFMGKIQK